MFSAESQDDLVECPYDKLHRMARKRLQPHLVKCRLSYPNSELCKCPFNVSHLVPEPEFTHHVSTCPDKGLLTQYKYNAIPLKVDEEDRKQDEVDCDDNWDDTEVEDYDPNKYATQANVIRKPVGLPSSRKEFRKNERKRLGDECDEDESKHVKAEKISRKESGREYSHRVPKPSSSSKYRIKEETYDESLKEWSRHRKHRTKEMNMRRNADIAYKLDEDPYYERREQ